MCYTDVTVEKYVTPSGVVSYEFDFGNYIADEDAITPSINQPVVRYRDIPNRSEQFFKDIIEDYLLTNEVPCLYPVLQM